MKGGCREKRHIERGGGRSSGRGGWRIRGCKGREKGREAMREGGGRVREGGGLRYGRGRELEGVDGGEVSGGRINYERWREGRRGEVEGGE